ncbi:MAG: hypothetical protein UX04_C0002G0330 [Microgenomates group bacterium GW2011_GWF2_45_18]|nr:MAG: hypothetical protein UW18_C0003G0232 [Microgenomates group bacterium GW2011_GWF1_44_10]KKU02187.1 MAG: hypothetical protein UX04_C0002G0330 [Microgenomates group bacterium GW2011_GWF2_45_18]OGJ40917.1 MAG: hypothetical protein A2378_03205 [Candidatus Pacebacteria bacterium RIFOXYB1_FULL_44_10]HAU99319.1 hypothetical protein [Candidatus Paceibacterota bacterium]HAX01838.1 hypothetical protein [Candidatus Paceibacterota bacterium]
MRLKIALISLILSLLGIFVVGAKLRSSQIEIDALQQTNRRLLESAKENSTENELAQSNIELLTTQRNQLDSELSWISLKYDLSGYLFSYNFHIKPFHKEWKCGRFQFEDVDPILTCEIIRSYNDSEGIMPSFPAYENIPDEKNREFPVYAISSMEIQVQARQDAYYPIQEAEIKSRYEINDELRTVFSNDSRTVWYSAEKDTYFASATFNTNVGHYDKSAFAFSISIKPTNPIVTQKMVDGLVTKMVLAVELIR